MADVKKDDKLSSTSSSEGAEIADIMRDEPDKAKKAAKHKKKRSELVTVSKKKNKPSNKPSSEVCQWLHSLGLPSNLCEKYAALFAEEEIFTLQQIACLKEYHLHDWIGVKTGTVLTMLDGIKRLNSGPQPDRYPSFSITGASASSSDLPTIQPSKEVYQAGGHGGVVRVSPGLVKKKTVSQEIAFYKEFGNLSLDKIPANIRPFFPKFHHAGKKSIVIEDLTYGYTFPCIADIKMGTRTAGENAGILKKNFMIAKDKATTTQSLGLRMVAARTYNHANHSWRGLTRSDCNAISDERKLENALGSFFLTGDPQPRFDVIKFFEEKLQFFSQWMEKQTSFRFYSSSLLFVFEADPNVPLKADVRMIDFAHVFPISDGGIDEGYLKGLKSLIKSFKRFLRKNRSKENDDDLESFYDTEFKDQFKDIESVEDSLHSTVGTVPAQRTPTPLVTSSIPEETHAHTSSTTEETEDAEHEEEKHLLTNDDLKKREFKDEKNHEDKKSRDDDVAKSKKDDHDTPRSSLGRLQTLKEGLLDHGSDKKRKKAAVSTN